MTTPSTDCVAGTSWAGVAGLSRRGSAMSKTAATAAVRTTLGLSMAGLPISRRITHVPAAKDASPVVGVVELGARDCGSRGSLVDFGREQHAQERRSQIDPEAHPQVRQERRSEAPSGVEAHPREWCLEGDVD